MERKKKSSKVGRERKKQRMRSALVPTKDFSFGETFTVHTYALILSHAATNEEKCTIYNDDSRWIVKNIVPSHGICT